MSVSDRVEIIRIKAPVVGTHARTNEHARRGRHARTNVGRRARIQYIRPQGLPVLRRVSKQARMADCALTGPIPEGSGGHYAFTATSTASRVMVRTVLPHSVDSTHFFGCDEWCLSSKIDLNHACELCHCAGCTSCASDDQDLQSCRVPGQIVSCSGARVVSRDATLGEVELHVGADRKFGCSIAAAPGAKHAPPQLKCLPPEGQTGSPPPAPNHSPPPPSPPPEVSTSLKGTSSPDTGLKQQLIDRTVPAEAGRTTSSIANVAPSATAPWVRWADECKHLLLAPTAVALSSVSYRVMPSRATSPAPRCEQGLQLVVEYSADGINDWRNAKASKEADSSESWRVNDLHCAETASGECNFFFRLRPSEWTQSSASSSAARALILPRVASDALRFELSFALGDSRTACLHCSAGQALFASDLTRVLRLPSVTHVNVVEVRDEGARGHVRVVFDLRSTPSRTAEHLAIQLASLLPLPRSEVYGGEVTQFIDRAVGLLQIGPGDATSSHRVVLPDGADPLTQLPGHAPDEVESEGGRKSSSFVGLLFLMVSATIVAFASMTMRRLTVPLNAATADDVQAASFGAAMDAKACVMIWIEGASECFGKGRSGGRHLKLSMTDDFAFDSLSSMLGGGARTVAEPQLNTGNAFAIADEELEEGRNGAEDSVFDDDREPAYVLSSGRGEYSEENLAATDEGEALERARALLAGMFGNADAMLANEAVISEAAREAVANEAVANDVGTIDGNEDDSARASVGTVDVDIDGSDGVLQRARDLLASSSIAISEHGPSLLVDSPELPPEAQAERAEPLLLGDEDGGNSDHDSAATGLNQEDEQEHGIPLLRL